MTRRDLRQAGLLGLYDASRRFDAERGNTFSTYARWWVRHHLNQEMRHGLGPVHVPDSALKVLWKTWGGDEQATPRKRREQVLGITQGHSLDDPIGEGEAEGERWVDRLRSDDNPAEEAARREQLELLRQNARELLSEREQHILDRYYSADRPSFRELGEELGISGERARQLHRQAIRTLREALRR